MVYVLIKFNSQSNNSYSVIGVFRSHDDARKYMEECVKAFQSHVWYEWAHHRDSAVYVGVLDENDKLGGGTVIYSWQILGAELR